MTTRSTRRSSANTHTRRRTRHAERAAKVNDAVEIWWAVDKTFYRGTLTRRHGEDLFRIVYDDGEMEDLDLTKETWRFSSDLNTNKFSAPAPDGEKHTMGDDADVDVVEVVLDGSDTPVGEAPKVVSKPRQRKKDRKAVNLHTDEKPQQKPAKKERAESASIVSSDKPSLGKESKEPANTEKSAASVAGTREHGTSASNVAAATDLRAPLSDTSKTRSKQKNVRNRKDAPVDEATSKTEAVHAGETNATPLGHVAAEADRGDVKADLNTAKEDKLADVKPVSPAQDPAPEKQSVAKGGNILVPAPPATSRGEGNVQVAKGNEHQKSALEQRAVRGKEGDGNDKSKVKVFVVQKPSEPLVKPTSMKTTVKERKSVPAARGKASKVKTPKGKADGASNVNLSPSVGPKVRLVKSKSGTTSSVVEPPKERPIGSKTGRSAGLVVDSVTMPAPKSAEEQTLKGEGWIKSRSSAGKDPPSFAGERKRKKRKQPDGEATLLKNGRAQAVSFNTTDNLNSTEVAMASGGRFNNSSSERVMASAQDKSSTSALPKSVAIVNSNSVVTTGQKRSGNQTKATTAQNGSTVVGIGTSSKEAINSRQAATTQTKTTASSEPPSQGQKRGRAEQHRTEATGMRTSNSESESMAKRLRSQSNPPSDIIGISTQKTMVHGAGMSTDATQMQRIVLEAITPLYSVLDVIKNDVHRLASMLPTQKQEIEFLKDVVHRSVVGEGSNTRTLIQELKSEMLQALEARARETEQQMTGMVERLCENRGRAIDNMNGYVPSGHQHDPHTTRALPNSAQMYEARQAPHPDTQEYVQEHSNFNAPILNSVSQSIPTTVPTFVTTGGNASPTAIANVNPNEMTTRLYGVNEGVGASSKDAIGLLMSSALGARVSHLVARQVTVWLLETPHEHDPQGPISTEGWARMTASGAFAKVAESLGRFSSYTQAYQTLCSSLGNDAVELQWFVSPGDTEHLHRARRNYAAWDPPPTDEEWSAEVTLLREMSERFGRALLRCDFKDMMDMEACMAIANAAASEAVEVSAVPDHYQMIKGSRNANQFHQ